MNIKSDFKLTGAILSLALLFLNPGPARAGEEIYALTEPSADIVMSFTVAGRVKDIPVKEGQKVEIGDLLIELNAEALNLRLRQLTLEAENQAEVLAAEAELKQKRHDLVKLEQAFKKGAATKMEIEHARLDVEISEYRLETSRQVKDVAALKKEELAAEIQEYRLLSPISGFVEKLEVEVGETAKTSENAARLVALDPLWVEANAPMTSFHDLAPGKEITAVFADGQKLPAKVVFRGAVADSASETIRVRLEVANPENRHAGERVILDIPKRDSDN